jgi:hypothetical protein
MEKQDEIRQTSRREMLRLSGMGVLGGAAVTALTASKAQALEGPPAVSYASWIGGNCMQVEYPERLIRLERNGWGTLLEGMPGTTNWFHFAIPTPVIVNDVRLQANCIQLSFATGSVDAFVRDVHVWDGSNRIAVFDAIYLQPGEPSIKLMIPNTPPVGFGLGISVGVEPLDHGMTFYAAGCDFVIRMD